MDDTMSPIKRFGSAKEALFNMRDLEPKGANGVFKLPDGKWCTCQVRRLDNGDHGVWQWCEDDRWHRVRYVNRDELSK